MRETGYLWIIRVTHYFFLFFTSLLMPYFPDPVSSEQIYKQLKDSMGHVYAVSRVTTLDELRQLSDTMMMDYKIHAEDRDDCLSCFKGIELDPFHVRGQAFYIKDQTSVIGVATLFAIPSKKFSEKLYVVEKNNFLLIQSAIELYEVKKSDTYLIEVGWLQLLPDYREKNLGLEIFKHVLVPTIKQLFRETSGDVIVSCFAEGAPDASVQVRIDQAIRKYEKNMQDKIPITKINRSFIGKVAPEALFTSITAEKMGLSIKRGAYGLSLGPLFSRRYHGLKGLLP